MAAVGGVPEQLTDIEEDEDAHVFPQMLPGGRAMLFSVWKSGAIRDERKSDIVVESTETRERSLLISSGTAPKYVSTGHLVFVRRGTLMAVAFDPNRLAVLGDPIGVVDDVMQTLEGEASSLKNGQAQFALSDSGSLAYVSGGIYPEGERELVWLDRTGTLDPLPLPLSGFYHPRISPDGRRVAYTAGRPSGQYVGVYDIALDIPARRTSGGRANSAVWSPNGEALIYNSTTSDGGVNLFLMAADGSGQPERLTQSDNYQTPASWSPDNLVTFMESRPGFPNDIMILPMEGDRTARPFLATEHDETHPVFSPDGRWIAYRSTEELSSGEVYVRPYPGPDPVYKISNGGGTSPAWSLDGKQLFFASGASMSDSQMMVVDVSTDEGFSRGRPRVLFDPSLLDVAIGTYNGRTYDVSADGRFLLTTMGQNEPEPATEINIILNWFEELKERVPVP